MHIPTSGFFQEIGGRVHIPTSDFFREIGGLSYAARVFRVPQTLNLRKI